MMLIEIQNLCVGYGNKEVLRNINLSLSKNEIVTIVGPNGSGKTTLFKSIIGSTPISSGKVLIRPNLKIGYVPQVLNIDRSLPLTVERFLSLDNRRHNREALSAQHVVVSNDLLFKQISTLSAGQLQRVLLSRALVNKPDVLLLDEATRGLDQSGSAAFYRKIEEIRNTTGCAILMISHDLHVVMSASNRVICLNGHICCQGEPQSVASSPEYKAMFGSNVDGTLALYQHNHNNNNQIER
ncbi:MAG: metal ABC transporter ATP-binding protein [Paracoccaceae bacterium]